MICRDHRRDPPDGPHEGERAMIRIAIARTTLALALLMSAGIASANCFGSPIGIYCDGTVRNVHVADGLIYVSLGNSIGGALGCASQPAPPGAPAAEYVTITPALPQYSEKYQAVLLAEASSSNVLVYLTSTPGTGVCAIAGISVLR